MMHSNKEDLLYLYYLALPSAEIGVADGSEEDLDSDLHFLGRMNLNLLDHEGLSGTI